MKIILFENNQVENLYPITLARPSFDILCAGTTLYQELKKAFPQANLEFIVRPYLQEYVDSKFQAKKQPDSQALFIDSALVPNIVVINQIASLVNKNEVFVVTNNNQAVVAYDSDCTSSSLDEVAAKVKTNTVDLNCKVFNHLQDVIVFNKEILASNLEFLKKNLKEKQPGVFVGLNVNIEDQVFFDSSEGPIVIEAGAMVAAFSVLRGPVYIGKHSLVRSFSHISESSIGEVCKVGGEVGESIFQAYSNKQHAGGIFHSYVGEWVNLGGGTTNSDLKNTYGKVKMGGQVTDQTFLGCIVGDYSKASIGTLIYTGKVIGVSSFLYANVFQDVPSFTNLLPDKLVECPLDIALRIQTAVRARREVPTTEVELKLLETVYHMTKAERKKSKVKKGKLE